MANSNPTQAERVVDYMTEFGSITQLEALRDIGVMRLASRISELKKQGYVIKSKQIPVDTRYGKAHITRYSLAVSADGR